MIGTPATICIGSDRYAGTVAAFDGTTLTVRDDHVVAAPESDWFGHQVWICTPDLDGSPTHFRKDRAGKWRAAYFNQTTGRWNLASLDSGYRLVLGHRSHYQDPHF